MYARSLIARIVIFILAFSLLFWFIRLNNILPDYKLSEDLKSIPILFGAGNLIFSVIAAFIIQVQWHKWDTLIDANRGEISMLRQLFIIAHHFPKKEMNEIRFYIYNYLKTYVEATVGKPYSELITRSASVDTALVQIEDKMFEVSKKYPDVGPLAFGYLTRAMEYRELKIQNGNQSLPQGIKFYILFATASVIIGTLFVPFTNESYNFYFALVVAALAFGVYLIIDDFDHPYRPGNYVLTEKLYKTLMVEIRAKLGLRGFDIEKAETEAKEPVI